MTEVKNEREKIIADANRIQSELAECNGFREEDFSITDYADALLIEVQAREKAEAHLQLQMKIDEQRIYTYRQGLIAAEIERDTLRQQLAERIRQQEDFAKQIKDSIVIDLRAQLKAAQAGCAAMRKMLIIAQDKLDLDSDFFTQFNELEIAINRENLVGRIQKLIKQKNPGQPLLDKIKKYEDALRDVQAKLRSGSENGVFWREDADQEIEQALTTEQEVK